MPVPQFFRSLGRDWLGVFAVAVLLAVGVLSYLRDRRAAELADYQLHQQRTVLIDSILTAAEHAQRRHSDSVEHAKLQQYQQQAPTITKQKTDDETLEATYRRRHVTLPVW